MKHAETKLRYRSDIDGLRAIAIGSVVLFHYNFVRIAPGGYVGVDIFFVISGYLITALIVSDLERTSFSIERFYARRIQRIFPAAIGVYLFVTVAALVFQNDVDAVFTLRNTFFSSIFVSNIAFSTQSSYFGAQAENNAVLHTWSLSVEEQFYIFFPLLMTAMRGRSRRTQAAFLFGAIIIGVVVATRVMLRDQQSAFYLVQYRFWELAIGALLVVGGGKEIGSKAVAQAVTLVGLALIVGSIVLLDTTSPFPGITALPGCLGAAMILHGGRTEGVWTSWLLSLPPMRFLGLLSYSLYLWHWPIYVFHDLLFENRSTVSRVGLIFLAVAVSYGSWRWIETPFRSHAVRSLPPRRIIRFGVIAMVAAITLSFATLAIRMTVAPDASVVSAMLQWVYYDAGKEMRSGSCFLETGIDASAFDAADCLADHPGPKSILLIGDSHAAHLAGGLRRIYPDRPLSQATASGCRPLVDGEGLPHCRDLMRRVFEDHLRDQHYGTIILSGRWRENEVAAAFDTAQRLKIHADEVVVAGPIVEYRKPLPRLVARAAATGNPRLPDHYRLADRKALDETMIAAAPPGIRYFSSQAALCDPVCIFTDEAKMAPVQFDYGHLTPVGSDIVARKMNLGDRP